MLSKRSVEAFRRKINATSPAMTTPFVTRELFKYQAQTGSCLKGTRNLQLDTDTVLNAEKISQKIYSAV